MHLRIVTFLAIWILVSCSSSKKVFDTGLPFQSECLSSIQYINQRQNSIPSAFNSIPSKYENKVDFTLNALVNALEIYDQFYTLLDIYSEDAGMDKMELTALESQIFRKIDLASMQISAIAGGLDCEEEKSGQLASFLEKKLRKREKNLTVSAIVTGAAVSVASGVILIAGGGGLALDLLGISGGLTEVFLGLSILKLDHKVYLEHPNNALKAIRDRNNSSNLFPGMVWYYLTEIKKNGSEKTLRDQLLERWDSYADLSEQELLVMFGEGGFYNPEMLQMRAEMLDQTEAQVTLMKQDLMYLMQFLNEAKPK